MLDIRLESPDDVAAIRAIHMAAFPTAAEADLVERLRKDGGAFLSLVGVHGSRIVGHVMFSKMDSPAGALGLAPVAVLEVHRRRGIASALICDGLARARQAGWKSVFVLGDRAYYSRFGFAPSLAEGFDSRYAGPHLMGIELEKGALAVRNGPLEYAPAFAALE